jgi:hypothetical protein
MANQRFTGTISLTSFDLSHEMVRSTASMLIGQGGTNIRRMTGEVPGSHVRLFKSTLGHHDKCGVRECDSVLVSARSQDDVLKIAKMIKNDIQSLMDPSKNSSRPTITMDCPKEAVGSVIGKGGTKLKDIQGFAGGDCFIRHDQGLGKFVISADNQCSLNAAELHIVKAIQKFHDTKHKWDSRSDNSDSDGDMEDVRPGRQETQKERELLTAMFKRGAVTKGMSERDRWSIRETLGKRQNADGSPVYKPYWRQTPHGGSAQYSGTHTVPWAEVDREIARRQQESRVLEEKRLQREKDLSNEKDRQSWEDSWETRTDTDSNSTWDAIEGHADKLVALKDAAGTSELQEKQEKVDDEKATKRVMVVASSRVRKSKANKGDVNTQVDLSDIMTKPATENTQVDLADLMVGL